jgi:hypothetical protein
MPPSRRSQIRTLAITLAAALALFLCLQGLLALFCEQVGRHNGSRFSQIARGSVNADILLAGNSRAVSLARGGRDVRRRLVFNLGYNGLSRQSLFAVLQDYFLAGNHAKVVLIEVSGLWSDGSNCELKTYWKALPTLAQASQAGCQDDAKPMRHFPLTRYNSELFLRAAYYLRKSDQDWADNATATPGQCALFRTRHDPNIRPSFPEPVRLRQSVAAFEAWMVHNAPGTRVLYVLAPYLAAAPNRADIQAGAIYADKTLVRGYLNLSDGLGEDCSALSDVLHLNDKGRAAVAGPVAAYIDVAR